MTDFLGGLQFPSILLLSASGCLRAWIWGKVFPSCCHLNCDWFSIAHRAALFLLDAHNLLDSKGRDYVIRYPFCPCLWEALTRFFPLLSLALVLWYSRHLTDAPNNLNSIQCLKLYNFCWSKDEVLAANGSGCIATNSQVSWELVI
jgi:hypothetical protein